MAEVSSSMVGFPVSSSRDILSEVLRAGAQQMLATAIEVEVSEWIAEREHLKNEQGHRQVIRNGHLPKRQIITGVGPLEVEQPTSPRSPFGP
jgi:putative transposase